MSGDLISRQDAIEAAQKIIDTYEARMPEWSNNDMLTAGRDTATKNGYIADGAEKVQKAIKDLPLAEPKRGAWVHDGPDFPHGVDWVHCSVCGKKGVNVPADLTNYCPNCGARMFEEEEE